MGNYAADQAGRFGEAIKDAIMKPINFIGGLVETALNVVISTFKAVYNGLAEAWNSTIGGFGFTTPDWLKYVPGSSWLANKSFHIPTLEPLAEGGIVTGPTAALIGEQGPEAVIPLSKMGAMGGNITINMPVGSNGDDVVRALQRYQAVNGPIPVNTRAF